MRKVFLFVSALMLLTMSSCENTSSGSEPPQDGIVLQYEEDQFDAAYAECIKRYFEALEKSDFTGYEETVYPPYQIVYASFLESNGSDLETSFQSMKKQFDEDGYENWAFTKLELSYCATEDVDNFFETWINAGIFDEAFANDCKADATEIRDVQFTLYAQYEGDDYTVPVVQNGEMIMLKTDAGCYLIG